MKLSPTGSGTLHRAVSIVTLLLLLLHRQGLLPVRLHHLRRQLQTAMLEDSQHALQEIHDRGEVDLHRLPVQMRALETRGGVDLHLRPMLDVEMKADALEAGHRQHGDEELPDLETIVATKLSSNPPNCERMNLLTAKHFGDKRPRSVVGIRHLRSSGMVLDRSSKLHMEELCAMDLSL